MKLMIVDDHTETRRLIRGALGRFATDICECADGDEAVERCVNFQPDIVIMDLNMPKMGGLEATPKILTLIPTVTVLVLSQSDCECLRKSAVRAGAKGYFTKDNFTALIRYLEQGQFGP